MKKISFFILLSVSAVTTAQSWNVQGNTGTSSGNFVGTADAQPLVLKSNNVEGLRINPDGQMIFSAKDGYGGTAITMAASNSSLGFFQIAKSGCNGCYGVNAGETIIRNLGGPHSMTFQMPNNNNDGSSYIGFHDAHNGTWVKIFNNSTARFNGKIFAKEVEVKANVWADYVFADNYSLAPLSEVEEFILKNRHLPNFPSAKEVMEKGIDVAKMDAKLLEKIEELTLYTISLEKQVKKLQQENSEFAKQREEVLIIKEQIQSLLNNNTK